MLIANYEPITESYFGKTKTLLECETVIKEIISQLRIKDRSKVGDRIGNAAVLNKSPLNKKLEKLIKKQFGFGEVKIHWIGQEKANMSGYTNGLVKLINTKMPKLSLKQNDGGYYDESHNYLCVIGIYCGLIDLGLKPDQILAFILHEIGHQFDCAPLSTLVSIMDIAFIPIEIYQVVLGFRELKDYRSNAIKAHWGLFTSKFALYGEKDERVKQAAKDVVKSLMLGLFDVNDNFKILNSAIDNAGRNIDLFDAPERAKAELTVQDRYIRNHRDDISRLWKAQMKMVEPTEEVIKKSSIDWNIVKALIHMVFSNTTGNKILLFHKFIDMLGGFSGENFADSFATAYGYGASLTAGIKALSDKNLMTDGFSRDNENNVYNQYLYILYQVLAMLCDPHPLDQSRIKAQIDTLKKELNKEGVEPEVAKQIERDLDKCEKIYNSYLDLPEEARHLTVLYNFINFNNIYFNGKLDVRYFLNNLLNLGHGDA